MPSTLNFGGGVRLEGDEASLELLEAIADNAEDMRPAFRRIDRTVGPFFKRRFDSAGAHGGDGPWAPLSETTRRVRPRSGGNKGGLDRPLWDTGATKLSLQTVNDDSIRVMRKHTYERGTRVPWARFHQSGFESLLWGTRQRGQGVQVPERHVIPDPLPRFLVERWVDVVSDWVMKGGKA